MLHVAYQANGMGRMHLQVRGKRSWCDSPGDRGPVNGPFWVGAGTSQRLMVLEVVATHTLPPTPCGPSSHSAQNDLNHRIAKQSIIDSCQLPMHRAIVDSLDPLFV
eukprot:scaffold154155_cov15-Prasinocladus_malaysianus.AAC.1